MLLPTMLPVLWPLASYGDNEIPTAHDYSVWVGHQPNDVDYSCESSDETCWGPLVCNIGDDGFIHYCIRHLDTFDTSPSWPAPDYDPDAWDVGYYLSLEI